MMLFGEKYPDPVRMVSMGEFSKELCGGTHLDNTREVETFEILSEEGVSAGTRRIVALTGATYLYHGEDPTPSGIEIVPMDTHAVLDEALVRHMNRASTRVMQRLLPPQDATLHLTVQIALVSYQLTDAELLVALHLDRATSSLRRMSESLPLDPLTLKRTLISLLERGFVARGEPAQGADETVPALVVEDAPL